MTYSFNSLTIAQQDLQNRLSLRAPYSQLNIVQLGDSMSGFQSEAIGYALANRMAAERSDFTFLGSQYTNLSWPYNPYPQYHEGHPGQTLDYMISNVASWISGYSAVPDIFIVNGGTNNFASDSGATCITKAVSLINTILAAAPNAYIVFWGCKPSPTSSPNEVARAAMSAGMPAAVASLGPRVFFVDPVTLTGLSAIADGVPSDSPAFTHPSDSGKNRIADAIYYGVLKPKILPPATAPGYVQKTYSSGVIYGDYPTQAGDYDSCVDVTAASTGVYSHANSALEPQSSGNWAVGFEVNFASSLSATAGAVYSYGFTSAYQLAISQSSLGAALYVGSSTPVTFDNSSSTISNMWPASGQWISVIIHYDATAQVLSVWRNGILVATKTGITPSFTSGDYSFLGYNSSILSGVRAAAYYRRWWVSQGSSVPSYANMWPYARAWRISQSMIPGVTAYYRLNDSGATSWASACNGTTITTYSGTPIRQAAGAIPAPWDPLL